MKLRNWVEQAVGKQWNFSPIYIGKVGGRNLYTIDWADGTSGDYFIDFDRQEIEEY